MVSAARKWLDDDVHKCPEGFFAHAKSPLQPTFRTACCINFVAAASPGASDTAGADAMTAA